MTVDPLDNAIANAGRRLDLSPDAPPGADSLALILAELSQSQALGRLGPRAAVRHRLASGDAALRDELTQALLGTLETFQWERLTQHARLDLSAAERARLLSPDCGALRTTLIRRAAQIAFEDIASERVAPEIRIAPFAVSESNVRAWLPGQSTHGLVFGELLHVTNELFPLMLDAYTHDLAYAGAVVTNVVGVHCDWLTGRGEAQRVLLYDAPLATLREIPLATPLTLDSVQFLYLGAREQELHASLEDLLGDRGRVNPSAVAALADNKQTTFDKLSAAGVPTPWSMAFAPGVGAEVIAARLRAAEMPAAGVLVVQPSRGTEGEGVTRLDVRHDDAASLATTADRIADLAAQYGGVVAREYVPGLRFSEGGATYAADLRLNVAWNGERFVAESGYLQVASDPAALASSVGQGGRVVAFSRGALAGLGCTREDLEGVRAIACAAAAALSAGAPAHARLRLVGVDVKLTRTDDGLTGFVLDLNPRPAGLSYSEYVDTSEPGVTLGLWRTLMHDQAIQRILTIVREDRDDDHRPILDEARDPAALLAMVEALRAFLRLEPQGSGLPKVFLLQERAVLILGDLLWRLKQQGALPDESALSDLLHDISTSDKTRAGLDEALRDASLTASEESYLAFINQFLTAVNEREMRDFALAKDDLLRNVRRRASSELRLIDANVRYEAVSPMRVGLSSANASDNWTFSKLRGGAVVNFAVDLSTTPGAAPRVPIVAEVEAIAEPAIELATISRMQTDRPTRAVIRAENAAELLQLPPDGAADASRCFRDVADPLLLLKYALVFSGVVGFRENPQAYVTRPARAIEDVLRFTGGRGLRLTLRSEGPSRSGFASSSCVALALLQVLYAASGQTELVERETLSSLALLLENEAGLKSGKQDTDGPLYPGVKSLHYRPTNGFLASDVAALPLDERALQENIVLVNSGIQRPAATGLRRGLNMRHYSYVSRDPKRFPAVMRSLAVHEDIVRALVASDWPRLGTLFDEYVDLRETIDPGATQSVFDAAAGLAVLRLPFQRLKEQGLIYGGLYSGAMGGGCMVLVAAPRGREHVKRNDGTSTPRLIAALDDLRGFIAGNVRPFANLEVYNYAVNAQGLTCRVVPIA